MAVDVYESWTNNKLLYNLNGYKVEFTRNI